MVYHHKISDTDQLKRVHIDYWAQLSKETLNRAIDQLLSVRHTARLSRTNRHKVIKSGKQSGFLAHLLYRQQERSLFTTALEQTPNVPTADHPRCWPIVQPRPTRRRTRLDNRPTSYLGASRRSRPAVAFSACILTGVPRRRRPGSCPLFHVPIPPATSTDCPAASRRREAVIPWPVVLSLIHI